MSQINANAALPSYSPADCEGIYVMSNGALVAILQQPAGSHDVYAVSTDSGATWTPHTFPLFPGLGVSLWRDMSATSVYVQDGNLVHQWGVETPGGSNDNGFYHRALPYDTSLNVFGITGATGGYRYVPQNGSIRVLPVLGGVAADKIGFNLSGSINGYWFTALQTSANIAVAGMTSDASFLGGWNLALLNYAHTGIADMHLRGVPGSTHDLFLSFTDLVKHQLIVIPLHWTQATNTWNNTTYTAETAYSFSGTDVGHTPFINASGGLELIIRDGINLYAVKRNGTASYGGSIPLYPGINQTTRGVATSYDSGTGGVLVAFESTGNQPNGELYSLRRSAGVWGSASLLDGGNADGYSQVLLSRQPNGASTPAILKHGAGVDYLSIPTAGPPFTPVVAAPAGNITTLTPFLTAPYVNPSSSDPIGFQQWQVQRVSDAVSFLDTGQVATTTGTLLYAGTTLVYGTPYQARVRYWDSVSAGGAGTASGWSAWSPFVPVHGPVATITSIVAGGATISSTPGTLVAPDMVVHFTYTQLSGDAANSYRLKLYAADAITLLQASPAVPGTIAAGASVTTFDTLLSVLQNLTVYFLAVESTDAVTGLSADGPQWQLTTAWTPPSTPGSFVVVPHDDLGTATGSWTNDGTAASNNLYYRPSGTAAWILAPKSGTLFTSFTALPPPQTPYDYRVSAVGTTGIESLFAEADAVILGGRGTAEWSVIINDLDDPTLVAWMGAPDSWDDLKWTPMKDRDVYLPLMGRFQKSAWGVEEWEAAQLKFYIFGEYWLKSGTLSPYRQDVLRLRQMYSNAKNLQYRDPRGRIKIVEMTLFSDAPADDFNDHCEFSLEEMDTAVMLVY